MFFKRFLLYNKNVYINSQQYCHTTWNVTMNFKYSLLNIKRISLFILSLSLSLSLSLTQTNTLSFFLSTPFFWYQIIFTVSLILNKKRMFSLWIFIHRMANIFIIKNIFIPGIDSLILVMNLSIQYGDFGLHRMSFIYIYATDICIRWLTWKIPQKKGIQFSLSLPNAHKLLK